MIAGRPERTKDHDAAGGPLRDAGPARIAGPDIVAHDAAAPGKVELKGHHLRLIAIGACLLVWGVVIYLALA